MHFKIEGSTRWLLTYGIFKFTSLTHDSLRMAYPITVLGCQVQVLSGQAKMTKTWLKLFQYFGTCAVGTNGLFVWSWTKISWYILVVLIKQLWSYCHSNCPDGAFFLVVYHLLGVRSVYATVSHYLSKKYEPMSENNWFGRKSNSDCGSVACVK